MANLPSPPDTESPDTRPGREQEPLDAEPERTKRDIALECFFWLVMPFAAVISGAVCWLLLFSILYFGQRVAGDVNGWFFRYVGSAMCDFTFGIVYARVAYELSPRNEVKAAGVMSVIFGLTASVIVVLAWVEKSFAGRDAILTTIGAVAAILGCIKAFDDMPNYN